MDTRYDVIVVGSGIGGLCAAALLAKRGKRVLVLEQHDQIGGYASKFRAGGFEFDVSLHAIADMEGASLAAMLRELGVLDRIHLLKPRYLYESLFDGERIALPNGDVPAIKRVLKQRFPKEGLGIEAWFFWMRRIRREVRVWERAKTSFVRRVVARLFAPVLTPLLVFGDLIPLAFALAPVRDRRLRGLLNQLWGYYGLPEGRINIVYPMAANYAYYYGGGYYIQGGGQQLCLALGAVIEENHGAVRTRAKVSELLVEGDRVIGVRTDGGETYRAGHVVASANPFIVYRDLLKGWDGGARILERINACELSISGSVMYLGLDAPIERLYPAYRDSYEVFVNGDMDREAEYRAVMATGFDRDYRDFSVTLYSNLDKAAAPPGKSIMNVFVADNLRRWVLPDEQTYRRRKEIEKEKLLDSVERVFPGLRQHIEVLQFATPLTMRMYTGNEAGALYGFSQRRGQSGPYRRFRNRGPLRALYFASAWTFPGGGYEGAMRAGQEVAGLIG